MKGAVEFLQIVGYVAAFWAGYYALGLLIVVVMRLRYEFRNPALFALLWPIIFVLQGGDLINRWLSSKRREEP